MDPLTERDPAKNPLWWYPPDGVRELAMLGRSPGWLKFVSVDEGDGVPRTKFDVDRAALARCGRLGQSLLRRLGTREGQSFSVISECYSALACGGPKLYLPTAEQFEAMEQVEIRIPIGQYRQPYPAVAVKVPPECRRRLGAELGLGDAAPYWVVVRHRRSAEERDAVVAHLGHDGEVFYLFQDQPGNETVEDALCRDAGDDGTMTESKTDALMEYGLRATRAAMNLCLMLTQTTHTLKGPDAPRNRRERRERELSGGASYLIVPDREIVVRQAQGDPGAGGGQSGHELTPHWRKGHWRAYPGRGAARAEGRQVPLVFVRPTLVRGDRAAPEAEFGTTTYKGT